MALYDRANVAGAQAALRDIASQDHVAVHFEGHVLPRVHGNKSRHIGASVNLPDGTKLDTAAVGRPDRIYYIRYYDGRGRRRLETTKSTDRNEAEKQLRKRLTAKDAGVSPEAAVGKLTIKDATDDVITDYKTNGRKSLRDVTAKTALHLLPFFGEKRRMNSITTADLRVHRGTAGGRREVGRDQP
jgi:hypothetical protein